MSAGTASRSLSYNDQGAGTPLVLLHGLTFSRRTWAPILDRLGDRVRTVTIDLPGHGQTGGPACTLWEAAARVYDTTKLLGIERPIVVGHSMAAARAGIYAASYPTLGLVMVDQGLDIRPFARMVRSLWPALSGPDFAAAFEPFRASIGVERVPEPLRADVARSQDIRQDVVLGYWDELKRTEPDDMQARIDETMSRIESPALAIFGRSLSAAERNDFLAHIPHAALEEWPGNGHCVHLVEADRFATRVREFAAAAAA